MANLSNINNKFLVTTGGNVGINTTSPGQKLVVTGNIGTSGSVLFDDNQGINFGNSNAKIYGSSSDGIKFNAGGSEGMRFNQSGNLGIGITPSSTNAITTQITNGLSLFGNNTTPYGFISNNHVWATGTGDKYLVSGYGASYYKQYQGVHSWATAPSGTAGGVVTFTERMRIDSSGNVGIGTGSDTLTRNLTVKGTTTSNVNIKSNASNGISILSLGDSGDDNYAQIILENSSNKLQIQNGGGGAVGNRGITLDSSENVGIGTDSPARELEVQGGGNVYIRVTASTDNDSSALELKNTQEMWTIRNEDTNADALHFNSDSGTKMVIETGGNVGIGTDSPDEKLSVNGNIFLQGNDDYIAFNTSASSGHPKIKMNSDADFSFLNTAGSNLLHIENGGNVGIGTTSPGNKLEVFAPGNGDGIVIQSDSAGTNRAPALHLNPIAASANERNWAIAPFRDTPQSLSFSSSNAKGGNAYTAATTRMIVDGISGNVGIGTNSPGQKLAIEGGGTANESILRVNNQGQVSSRIWLRNQGQSGYIFNSGSTGDTLASGIAAQGFGMGINNNSPIQFYNGSAASVKLSIDVDGVANFTGSVIAGTTSDYTDGVGAVVGNSPAGDNGGFVDVHANGDNRYYTRIAHGATGSGSAGYWHVKTNMVPSASVMFLAKIYGYVYGQSSIVDLQHSGYAYAGSNTVIAQGTVNNGSSSGMSTAIYLTSNLEVCFRVDLSGSTYYAGLWMDVGLQNPTGGTHILEVLGSAFSTTANYYT